MKKTSVISVTSAVLVCTMTFWAARTSSKLHKASEKSDLNVIGQSAAGLLSPYDVEQYINQHKDEANLNEIWSRFGIQTELGKPGRCGCRGYDCPGTCNAEVINVPFNDGNSGYAILRVCYAGGADCWYLAFKRELEWRYLGITESLHNQYEPPQQRIEEYQSEHWLVIRELSGRGTGFLDYGERWCAISDEGMREVFSYPVSGRSVQGNGEDYELTSKVSSLKGRSSFSVDIHYTVYTDSYYAKKIRWSSTRKYELLFEWDIATKRFVLDDQRSKLPKSERDPIFRYLVRYRSVK